MDALSSQANIGGYKAVILAASTLPQFFPMLTTAAGTIPPAKALILGAGVAGLASDRDRRRLGAVVSAYDTRAVVKEQVQSARREILRDRRRRERVKAQGGYARELSRRSEVLQQRLHRPKHIAAPDVVITTAAVPGRRAPLLVTEDAVKGMEPGSVIVDLAAESGGNCALTDTGRGQRAYGVTIVGTTNLPSTVPYHASQLYSRNVSTLLGCS